jgi:2-methylisocitrate lyase-like PEP mutase family enzyme
MLKNSIEKSKKLRALLNRQDKVLAVFHPPSAALARVMDQTGCEAGFVGTSGVVGSYTGLSDVGTASMTECIQIGGWISQAVNFPIILDGDTGHGGIMAIRRLVHECIKAGISGVRIDDQPIEGKRMTGSAGVEVVPIHQAIARYRAAVDAKNEINPDFVIMAQCYAGNATNSNFKDTLLRLQAYRDMAGVDWVQLEYPKRIDDIIEARALVSGPFSFMKGGLSKYLNFKEHLDLGVNIAWYPSFTHQIIWSALRNFMADFGKRDLQAWEAFMDHESLNPCPNPLQVGSDGEGLMKQRELEERYYSKEMLLKYQNP